jgi:hypothetical protein
MTLSLQRFLLRPAMMLSSEKGTLNKKAAAARRAEFASLFNSSGAMA